jgi:hypothetical protein
MPRNLTVAPFLGLAAMLFMAGAAAAQTPSKPQIITEKTALRSDVIDRFIAAQLQVATVLSGMGKGDSKADADAMPKLSAAVDQLTSVKTELKKDSFEDSQQLQALLKQKYSALVDASARSHAQVTRVRSVIKNNKDLLALLNNI